MSVDVRHSGIVCFHLGPHKVGRDIEVAPPILQVSTLVGNRDGAVEPIPTRLIGIESLLSGLFFEV